MVYKFSSLLSLTRIYPCHLSQWCTIHHSAHDFLNDIVMRRPKVLIEATYLFNIYLLTQIFFSYFYLLDFILMIITLFKTIHKYIVFQFLTTCHQRFSREGHNRIKTEVVFSDATLFFWTFISAYSYSLLLDGQGESYSN